MKLVTKCYSCGGEIIFADGSNTVQCEYCGRTNARPKSQPTELELMKYSNERLSFGEFDEAEVGYRKVLQRTPDEHEARWGLLLCKYGVRYVEDIKTGQRLPTCRRALLTSFCAEPDFRLAYEAAPTAVRMEYEKDGRYIDDIQKEIRRLKTKREMAYDIFLCYKETDGNKKRTQDSMLAQNLKLSLQRLLPHVHIFYAPDSLRKSPGSSYEATIYCALESSKVMLLLATKPHYLQTTWVKSEWKRFLDRMDSGEDKLIIPIYRDFNPEELPEEFNDRFIQGLDMRDPRFMYDLEAFLRDIFPAPEIESIPDTGSEPENSKLETAIKRGFCELEDGCFDDAKRCFEAVLNEDYENARANLGMAMATVRARTKEEMVCVCSKHPEYDELKYMARFERFGDQEMKALAKEVHMACEKARAKAKENVERIKSEYSYSIDAEGVTIQKYIGDSKTVLIPDVIENKAVLAIGKEAFEDCACLEEVTIPEGVIRIGEAAFAYCRNLREINIPKSVSSLGALAFMDCYALESAVIPEGVTSVEPGLFKDCTGLKTVSIPQGVVSIGNSAFYYCKSLKSVELPEGVKTIGHNAFNDCGMLESVYVPDSVTMIDEWAFAFCKRLRKFTMPSTITSISESLFSCCSSLVMVDIPKTVMYVGRDAFSDCEKLKKVYVNASAKVEEQSYSITEIIRVGPSGWR